MSFPVGNSEPPSCLVAQKVETWPCQAGWGMVSHGHGYGMEGGHVITASSVQSVSTGQPWEMCLNDRERALSFCWVPWWSGGGWAQPPDYRGSACLTWRPPGAQQSPELKRVGFCPTLECWPPLHCAHSSTLLARWTNAFFHHLNPFGRVYYHLSDNFGIRLDVLGTAFLQVKSSGVRAFIVQNGSWLLGSQNHLILESKRRVSILSCCKTRYPQMRWYKTTATVGCSWILRVRSSETGGFHGLTLFTASEVSAARGEPSRIWCLAREDTKAGICQLPQGRTSFLTRWKPWLLGFLRVPKVRALGNKVDVA